MRSIPIAPIALLLAAPVAAQNGRERPFQPEIPRMWDRAELRATELPLADAAATPVHATPEQYYSMPVRPIYASYPIYHPDREPPGYLAKLREREPRTVWDPAALRSQDDWVRAGRLVFDTPLVYDVPMDPRAVRDPQWYEITGTPLLEDGVMPFARYVIREKGVVEVGGFSCGMCHSRAMPDGSLLKGAQGNFPFDHAIAQMLRRRPAEFVWRIHRLLFGAPWIDRRGDENTDSMTVPQILQQRAAIPPGVAARSGGSPRYPMQIPDLIGIGAVRYLDHTAVQKNRGIADLMRYAALNQGANMLASYRGFRPIEAFYGSFPDLGVATPRPGVGRYSDEQLYALALFLHSLEPPQNPNPFDDLARQGERVFERERCARCHEPPLYTNNRLTPAPGIDIPDDHPAGSDVMRRSIGTDPGLATRTRRGTGLYKIPSLRGLWYRGPLEHSGSVGTLEEWFDPRRLSDDFASSGWRPAGKSSRAVPGHEFGLGLSTADRMALIAFLKTL